MKLNQLVPILLFMLSACSENKSDGNKENIKGTWQLQTATTIENGLSNTTDFTKDLKMIKIINDTHFSFLKHSINPKDSSNFDAGGGRYSFKDNNYTEYLDYYKDKKWEGKRFKFKVSFSLDTLIQKGEEKVEEANINRIIIEKYIRIK